MKQAKLLHKNDKRPDEFVLKQDLLAQIAWVARLRWITIAILLFVITVGGPFLKVLEQSFLLYFIVGIMALPNLMPCTYGVERLSKLRYRAFWHFFGDITTLTALIYVTSESIENPFLAFFMFYIIIASIILPKRLSYLLAGLSVVLLGLLPFCGYYGILPHYNVNKYVPHELAIAMNSGQFMFPIFFAFSSTLFLIVYITTSIMQRERDRAAETRSLKAGLENKIEELELTQQQLIFSAKMSAVGELSAGVAHEVNNPLDGLLNCIRRMQQDPKNLEQNNAYLELMAEAVGRIEATIRQLLDFSRPHELTVTDVNLNHTVDRTIALIEYKATAQGIQIQKAFQHDLTTIPGDKHLLEQLTLNLALNAITAMPDGGTLRFQTGYTLSEGVPGASGIYLKVMDTGVGMSETTRQRIFEMFYTTSETGEGLGLGLAVSDWIVKKHHGVIEVESELGKGSTFCVKIPLIPTIEGGQREPHAAEPFKRHPEIEQEPAHENSDC